MRRSLIVLMTALIVFAGFGGIGSYAKTEVTFFAWAPGTTNIPYLLEMEEIFEKENPDIDLVLNIDYGWGDYFTKLATLAAAGELPDTYQLNYENFIDYATKGGILPLDSLIAQDKDFSLDIFHKRTVDAFNLKGTQYGLCRSYSDVVLFYNQDLFDAAGVDYPNINWSWYDQLKAALKLTKDTDGDGKIDQWGFHGPIQFWEFYKTIAQNGGSVFNMDKTQVTVNSPEAIEALQWMIDQVRLYHVQPSTAEMAGQSDVDLFKAGKLAMLKVGVWMLSDFRAYAKFKWDVALEPAAYGRPKAHHFFANAIVISPNAKNPQAAWEWLKFYTASTEANRLRVEAGWELPPVKDPAVKQAFLDIKPPEHTEVFYQAVETAVFPPYIPNWGELTAAAGRELELAVLGEKTPKEALDDLKVKIEELLR